MCDWHSIANAVDSVSLVQCAALCVQCGQFVTCCRLARVDVHQHNITCRNSERNECSFNAKSCLLPLPLLLLLLLLLLAATLLAGSSGALPSSPPLLLLS
jgi:hypothetical protein